jgi:hypothetical protein
MDPRGITLRRENIDLVTKQVVELVTIATRDQDDPVARIKLVLLDIAQNTTPPQ